MKKRSAKSLILRKSSISKLGHEQIKGGTSTFTTFDPVATINLPTSNCTLVDDCITFFCLP